MTITPSELEITNQAADLIDAICTATRTHLNTTQRAKAAAVIETCLEELRKRWRAAGARQFLTELRDSLDRSVDR